MTAILGSLFGQVWGYLALAAAGIGAVLWIRQSGVNSQKVSDLTSVQKDESVAHTNETAVADMSVQQLDSIVRKPSASD